MAKLLPLVLRSEPKSSRTSEEPEEADVASSVPMSLVFFDVDQLFGDGNAGDFAEVSAGEPAATTNSAAVVEASSSSLAAATSTGSSNTFSTVVDGNEITLSLNNADCVRELVCPENGARVFVIGTAHFSEQSQKDVTALISRLKPDCVVLELCAARAAILELDEAVLLDEASSRITVDRFRMLVRKHGGNVTRAVLECLLLNLSAHVAKELGMAPGGEFRAAARAAHELNRTLHSEQPATEGSADRQPAPRRCRVLLGDRPISVTLQRAFATLSAWHKLKLFCTLIASSFESITREQVEAFKNRDMLVEALRQLAGSQPQFSAVLVDERDAYLATSLRVAALDIPELERAQQRDANRPPQPQQAQPEAQTSSADAGSGAGAEATPNNEYNAALRRAVRRPPLVVGVVALAMLMASYATGMHTNVAVRCCAQYVR